MTALALLVTAAAIVAAAAPAAASPVAPRDPEPISDELRDTRTGVPCGLVEEVSHRASGGCDLHAVARPLEVLAHTFFGEQLLTRCDQEFTASVAAAGGGRAGMEQTQLLPTAGGGTNCSGYGAALMCSEVPAQQAGYDIDGRFDLYRSSDGSLWARHQLCVTSTSIGTVVGYVWLKAVEDGDRIVAFAARGHRLDDPHARDGRREVEIRGRWTLRPPSVEVGG